MHQSLYIPTSKDWIDNHKAPLQVAVGALLMSFSSIFVKLSSVSSSAEGFYRMLFGGLSLLLVALIARQSFKVSKKNLIYIIFCGLFFSADIYSWHHSIHYIGPGLATTLGNLQVFLLALVGLCIYKEKVNWKYYISLPVALLGLFFLVGSDWGHVSHLYKVGVYLGFSTAFFYTLCVVFLRKTQSNEKSLEPIANLTLISFVCVIFFFISGHFDHESFAIPDMQNFIWLFCYGLFGQALGWLLLSRGLPNIELSVAGFLILLQPAGSFLWDILIFHRQTPLIQVIGALLLLAAIYLSSIGHIKPSESINLKD